MLAEQRCPIVVDLDPYVLTFNAAPYPLCVLSLYCVFSVYRRLPQTGTDALPDYWPVDDRETFTNGSRECKVELEKTENLPSSTIRLLSIWAPGSKEVSFCY